MVKLRVVVMVGVVGAFVGCHASHDQVRGPDGTMDWFSIECRRNQGNCYEEAGDVCPNGYDIADTGGHSGEYVQADKSDVIAVPTYSGHMLIKCKSATSEPENEIQQTIHEAPPEVRGFYCSTSASNYLAAFCMRDHAACAQLRDSSSVEDLGHCTATFTAFCFSSNHCAPTAEACFAMREAQQDEHDCVRTH